MFALSNYHLILKDEETMDIFFRLLAFPDIRSFAFKIIVNCLKVARTDRNRIDIERTYNKYLDELLMLQKTKGDSELLLFLLNGISDFFYLIGFNLI